MVGDAPHQREAEPDQDQRDEARPEEVPGEVGAQPPRDHRPDAGRDALVHHADGERVDHGETAPQAAGLARECQSATLPPLSAGAGGLRWAPGANLACVTSSRVPSAPFGSSPDELRALVIHHRATWPRPDDESKTRARAAPPSGAPPWLALSAGSLDYLGSPRRQCSRSQRRQRPASRQACSAVIVCTTSPKLLTRASAGTSSATTRGISSSRRSSGT